MITNICVIYNMNKRVKEQPKKKRSWYSTLSEEQKTEVCKNKKGKHMRWRRHLQKKANRNEHIVMTPISFWYRWDWQWQSHIEAKGGLASQNFEKQISRYINIWVIQLIQQFSRLDMHLPPPPITDKYLRNRYLHIKSSLSR